MLIALSICLLTFLYWLQLIVMPVPYDTPSMQHPPDSGPPFQLDERQDLLELERSVNVSPSSKRLTHPKNQSVQKCQHPVLHPLEPSVMQFYRKHPPVNCTSAMEDWVYVTNGTFHISSRARRPPGEITCEYAAILRDGDFAVRYSPPVKPMQDGQPIQTDFFKVSCVSEKGAKYENIHSAVAWNPAVHERLRSYAAETRKTRAERIAQQSDKAGASGYALPLGKGLPLSVFMLGFDSLSRMAWMRSLPKTRQYFLKDLGGLELGGYNIVGDGTPSALLPILTGRMEEELPEARRGFSGATTVDKHPWIWRDFSRRGYVTAWAEDSQNIATFHYRMLGFKDPPTDHYTRPFFLAAEREYHRHLPLCWRSIPRHVAFMHWIRDMFDMYESHPKFFFGFHSEMSHGDNNVIQALDGDLVTFLQELETKGYLNSTLLILMSDHGARFGYIRATSQGKLEERMPYFSFRFPPWFQRQYPDIIKNMKINANRLTTPFDIHETFLDILHYTGSGKANLSRRGVSLFSEVPEERTCTDAEVTPHWCACLEWQPVNQSDALVVAAVKEAIARVNLFTRSQRRKCAELTLSKITRSSRYVCTNEDSEAQRKIEKYWNQYRKASNGRFDGTACKAGSEYYQLSFITKPGEGHFEAMCYHDVTSGSFKVSEQEISRIDRYGSQAACIESSMPHLRPYCYCV